MPTRRKGTASRATDPPPMFGLADLEDHWKGPRVFSGENQVGVQVVYSALVFLLRKKEGGGCLSQAAIQMVFRWAQAPLPHPHPLPLHYRISSVFAPELRFMYPFYGSAYCYSSDKPRILRIGDTVKFAPPPYPAHRAAVFMVRSLGHGSAAGGFGLSLIHADILTTEHLGKKNDVPATSAIPCPFFDQALYSSEWVSWLPPRRAGDFKDSEVIKVESRVTQETAVTYHVGKLRSIDNLTIVEPLPPQITKHYLLYDLKWKWRSELVPGITVRRLFESYPMSKPLLISTDRLRALGSSPLEEIDIQTFDADFEHLLTGDRKALRLAVAAVKSDPWRGHTASGRTMGRTLTLVPVDLLAGDRNALRRAKEAAVSPGHLPRHVLLRCFANALIYADTIF